MAIDVDQLYAKYAGQTLDYDGLAQDAGQCVQWVEYVLTDTQYGYGLKPFWGNAIDWWNNYGGSLAAFDKITDGSIKKGDIVIFNQLVGSPYGHIDLAMQDGTTASFLGADSNWNGNKTVHEVQHNGSQYVIGSLRLKGENDMATPAQIDLAFKIGFNRPAAPEELSNQDYLNDTTLLLQTIFNNNVEFRTKAAQFDALKAQFDDYVASHPGNTSITTLKPGTYQVD